MNVVVQRFLNTSLRSFAPLSIKIQLQPLNCGRKPNFLKAFHDTGAWKKFQRKMTTQTTLVDKPKIVFVLGAPGSGKGTQCSRIVNEFGYVHLSAGDLLRAERNRPGSDLAETIEEHIRGGRIIPVAVTCSLLERAINEQIKADATKNKFLIDGFPRNQDNLDGWTKQMEAKVDLQFVLFFDCPDAVCIDRCLNRGTGRSDDNMDSLKKRFDVFHSDTMPIVDHYEKQSLLRRLNGEKPAELVFEDVKQAFADYDAK